MFQIAINCLLASLMFISFLNSNVVDIHAQDTQAEKADPSVEEQLRELIPAATAIDRKTFEAMATATTGPTKDSFKEQSLSAVLFMMNVKETKQEESQFRWLTEKSPEATEIAAEMYHSIGSGKLKLVTRPVTMIQAERITKMEVKVDGDKATGSFEFHVPKLYEGDVNFVAAMNDNKWQFTEFEMENPKVRIARDESGKWQKMEAENAE